VPLAGHGLRPTALRRRAGRPQLKRDPLGRERKHVTPNPIMRRGLLAVALMLLLGLAWLGLSGGVQQIPESHTLGQIAQTGTQLAYGVFALLSAVTTFWGRSWARALLAFWLGSVTLAAGLASVVWGGTSFAVGLLSGVAACLVALTIIWLLRIGAEQPGTSVTEKTGNMGNTHGVGCQSRMT